jgi:hypothetical protein
VSERSPYKRFSSSPAALSAALVVAACRTGGDGPSTPPQASTASQTIAHACPGAASTTDPLQNCVRYCEEIGCSCEAEVADCEAACASAHGDGTLNAPCLACAVDHAGELAEVVTCDEMVPEDDDASFTILWAKGPCGAACNGERGGD